MHSDECYEPNLCFAAFLLFGETSFSVLSEIIVMWQRDVRWSCVFGCRWVMMCLVGKYSNWSNMFRARTVACA